LHHASNQEKAQVFIFYSKVLHILHIFVSYSIFSKLSVYFSKYTV